MKPGDTFPEKRNLFKVFILAAQYITHLTPQQDILAETGNAIARFYGASLVGFFEKKDGELISHHWILPEGLSPGAILTEDTRKIVSGVFASGFLETRHLNLADRYAVAFLPITWESRTTAVMLVGHRATGPIPDELLNTYLAVAGLVSTAISGAVAAFGNIAERKRAEESQALLASIVTYSEDAIYSKTPEGIITSWNAGAEKMYGYTPEEAIGRHVAFLGPDEYAGETDSLLSKIRNGERIEHYETTRMRKNGERITVSLIVSPVKNAGGALTGTSTIARDITEQKRTEVALATAHKKLNILSSITRHDINNQLLTLSSYLFILEKDRPELSSDRKFQNIVDAARRITSIIGFAKEYEKIGIKAPVWQDLRNLVDDAIHQSGTGNIRVENDLPVGFEIFTDPLVARVLFNLIDNAVRYGGKITKIRFSVQTRDGDRFVLCEDDGVGVSADEKEKIFGLGYGKNTGLGLSLSRDILSITDMTILETGIPGAGARFEIAVPRGGYRVAAGVRSGGT